MLDRRDAVEALLGALARSTKCEGKGQVVVRPDTSQVRGYRANRPGLSAVGPGRAEDDSPSVARAARLGVALAGFADELAAARREIVVLKRENTALRSKPVVEPRHRCEVVRHEPDVARSLGFAHEADAEGDVVIAVGWLQLLEAADHGSASEWQGELDGWLARRRFAGLGEEPAGSDSASRRSSPTQAEPER